jgi:hypothetical protein
MKRFILILLVMALLPLTNVRAQVSAIVSAPTLEALQQNSFIQDVLFWTEQAIAMGIQIEHFVTMIQTMENQVENQVKNLRNIGEIHSYKDFMDWYNRQLYLERKTEETFTNMNVTIGNRSYKLTDVEGMAYGFNDTFVDHWNKEFTEDQRREMWVKLGVTPSNYAYIQTWNAREQQIAHEFLAAREIQNEKYKNEMERNNENQKALEKDKAKSDDDPSKMGEKGIAVINAETNIANNRTLNDIEGHLADIKESIAIDMYQKRTPSDQPTLSEWKEDVGFIPLKK